MRVAIIGAGISGLSLGYYLQRFGIAYDLFEASDHVGGNIKTIREGEYVLELGPNSIQYTPELEQLIQELKLEGEVLLTPAAAATKFVIRRGVFQKLPTTPLSLLSNKHFTWKTKYRVLKEKDIPAASVSYETVNQFIERRFGPDLQDYIINPFISGMYAGDPDKLLIHKAFPRIKELETKYGSVLKGLPHFNPYNRREKTFSFVKGMQTLPDAIADKLISLHTGHRVELITRVQGKYIVSCNTSGNHDTEEYDVVVLALPAMHAADLLQYTFPGMAAALNNIEYPPMAIVHTVYNRSDVKHTLHGFGALNSKADAPFAACSIWSSSLFNSRCRPHEVMFTSFIGGAQYPTHALLHPDEIMQRVHEELTEKYSIRKCKPNFQHVHLWKQSIPQFDMYIQDAHELAHLLQREGLYTAANWQAGISVSACVHHAKELAHKINLKRSAPAIAD
jgi:protoporphyrinogen/coproporphyrinogen III oxidase